MSASYGDEEFHRVEEGEEKDTENEDSDDNDRNSVS